MLSENDSLEKVKSKTRKSKLLWLFTPVVLLLLLGAGVWFFISANQLKTDITFTADDVTGLQIKNTKTHSININSELHQPQIGLPEIDKTIDQFFEIQDQRFWQELDKFSGLQWQKPKSWQDVKYEILLNNKDFLSIKFDWQWQLGDAQPEHASFARTFDKKRQKVLRIDDLFARQKTEQRIFWRHALKLMTAKGFENTSSELANLAIDDGINFLLENNEKINFTVSSPHNLTLWFENDIYKPLLTVNVIDFSHLLQNDLATKLFAIKKLEVKTLSDKNAVKGFVSLTFDDGPDEHTERLLDILKQYDVQAAFFLIGNKIKSRDLTVQRIKSENHDVGNHSWSHPSLKKQGRSRVEFEISETNRAIRKVLPDYQPKIMRPPYGEFNNITIDVAQKHDLALVLWSVDTRDWADKNSEVVCRRVLSDARAGSIVLLHDIHVTSVDAVPCIIEGLVNSGYKIVKLTDLLNDGLAPGKVYFRH